MDFKVRCFSDTWISHQAVTDARVGTDWQRRIQIIFYHIVAD